MKKLVIKYNKTNVTSSLNMASLLGIKHKVLLALIDRLSPSFKKDRGERYFKLQQNLKPLSAATNQCQLYLLNYKSFKAVSECFPGEVFSDCKHKIKAAFEAMRQ